MKKILIGLMLLIGAFGGTEAYLYYNGIGLFDWFARLNGQIAPVTVPDTTKTYSLVQSWALEGRTSNFPRNEDEMAEFAAHIKDKTYVPPVISYVRVAYLASAETKPYPKIFFADQAFPSDTWLLEDVAVVKPATLIKVLSSAQNLSCQSNSATGIYTNQIEVLMRPANKPLQRCLLKVKDGCKYFTRLNRLTRELRGKNDRYLLPELKQSLDCPTSSLPWDHDVNPPSWPANNVTAP